MAWGAAVHGNSPLLLAGTCKSGKGLAPRTQHLPGRSPAGSTWMLDLLRKRLRGCWIREDLDAVHVFAVDEERTSAPQGVGSTRVGDWGPPATGVRMRSLGHGRTIPVAWVRAPPALPAPTGSAHIDERKRAEDPSLIRRHDSGVASATHRPVVQYRAAGNLGNALDQPGDGVLVRIRVFTECHRRERPSRRKIRPE